MHADAAHFGVETKVSDRHRRFDAVAYCDSDRNKVRLLLDFFMLVRMRTLFLCVVPNDRYISAKVRTAG
jgi:hypothetical protein